MTEWRDIMGGMSERPAVLVRWLKGDGEFVQLDEVICEMATADVTVDVPAYATGMLRQLAKEGEPVLSAAEIARIEPVA